MKFLDNMGTGLAACLEEFDLMTSKYLGMKLFVAVSRQAAKHMHLDAGISKGAVYAGLNLGFLTKNMFIPSPWLFEIIYKCVNTYISAVEVKERGVKAFLYGNDILLQSVEKVYPPIAKRMFVAVVDASDGRVVGVALALYGQDELQTLLSRLREGSEDPNKVVMKNILDIGCFVRRCVPRV